MLNRRMFLKTTLAGVAATALLPTISFADSSPYSKTNILKLNSNENSLGMSAHAKAAAIKGMAIGHRYPDDYVTGLAAKIAKIEGLGKNTVSMADGSTGILEAVIRQQAAKGATLIAPAITYGDAEYFAKSWDVPFKSVPMAAGFKIDLKALEAASLAIKGNVVIYLVTPNNPSGLLSNSDDIAAWIKRAPSNVFFIVDEAYHEYVSDPSYMSMVSLVREGHDNLIVARTFSKVYAMAGMRMGYGMATADVMAEIKQHYSSWSVSIASIFAASASLDDKSFLARSIASNAEAKKITYDGLAALGLNFMPSQTNFMLHEIGPDLKAYQNAMLNRHVKIGRDMGLGTGWNRLSVGTPDEMRHFLKVLSQVKAGGWV